MNDLQPRLDELKKPHMLPARFQKDLRRRLLEEHQRRRQWQANLPLLCLSLALAATLLLFLWKPVVALKANQWLLGSTPQFSTNRAEPGRLDQTLGQVLPASLASYDVEGDQKLLQDWARHKGLRESAAVRILAEELVVRRRYLLPDGREVEVVSTVPASNPQPINNIY
jgi:hypothetical protein